MGFTAALSARRKRPRPRTSPRDEYADRLAVARLVGRTRILAGGDERCPSVHQTHDGLSREIATCRLANPLQRPLSERRKVNPMTEMTQRRFK